MSSSAERKSTKDKTVRLFTAPAVQEVKDKAKEDLAKRTSAAICRVREAAVPPLNLAGTWKLHQRANGFVLTRQAGETLIVTRHPGSSTNCSVSYDGPVDYYPDNDADANARQQEEGPC
jgi:hypothetical protein